MSYIFISYSHKDKEYVHKLQEALHKEGFEVWIDDRIDYGTEWPKVIQNKLDSCDAFIVVISENAYESTWVQNEVARAVRKNKPFFPLLLQGDPWLSVEATQYVNVTGGLLPPEKFYQRLEKVAQRKRKNFFGKKEDKGSKSFQLEKIGDLDDDTLKEIDVLFSDWASTATMKRDVLRKLGLLARSSISENEIKKIADVVVRGLYDKDIKIRNTAVAILGEIGKPAIESVLNAELNLIPGRRRGRWLVMDVLGSMGVETIPDLVSGANKFKNGDVVLDVLCYRMPIEHTIGALKDFFLQPQLDSRKRETIFSKLAEYTEWYKVELKDFLMKGIKHPDPLVRVLSARWYVTTFPSDAKLTLKHLLKDKTMIEYRYDEKAVSEIVSNLLMKMPK